MVVKKAIQKDGLALPKASDLIRDDKNIVLANVKFNGNQLKYASERLRDD